MFGYFYAESGGRVYGWPEFETAAAAVDHWRSKKGMWEVAAAPAGAEAAFVHPTRGTVVVVKEVGDGAADD